MASVNKAIIVGNLGRDPEVAVHIAPGNPGTAGVGTNHPVDAMDGEAVAALEGATYTPALKDVPFGLEDASVGEVAERLYTLPGRRVADPKACQCGEVLQGKIKPFQCKVFGTACKPETPIGTCMVSPEGACAAYYQYGRLGRIGTGAQDEAD